MERQTGKTTQANKPTVQNATTELTGREIRFLSRYLMMTSRSGDHKSCRARPQMNRPGARTHRSANARSSGAPGWQSASALMRAVTFISELFRIISVVRSEENKSHKNPHNQASHNQSNIVLENNANNGTLALPGNSLPAKHDNILRTSQPVQETINMLLLGSQCESSLDFERKQIDCEVLEPELHLLSFVCGGSCGDGDIMENLPPAPEPPPPATPHPSVRPGADNR
ncbi:hypothetical protein AVEN_104292-1 [Araneus ventricosus]|uniref:Uncharacterized protein n=1 Tax=Araneus ventricosus TaxID=182803 RepID=A0A4Y2T8C6_ARAVE|nr:hypothetical protein AVEN_104292-1 [Araneus ventricosus]